MRKLYTDVTLETPFMVSYNDGLIQACANDEDTITIGAVEFIRITDADGHNVADGEGNQLLLDDGIIYKLVNGVPESTNVQVTDVVIPERYTLTISPTPNNATVTLTATGETQVGNSITVDDGTTVSYTVSATGYVTTTGTYTIDGVDYTLNITLVPEVQNSTVTIYPTPNNATVSFTCSDVGASISGNAITCAENSTLSYTISAQGYNSYTCPSFTVEGNSSVYIALLQTGYYAGWEYTGEFTTEQIYTDTANPVVGDTIYDSVGDDTGDTVQAVSFENGMPIISQYGQDFQRAEYLDYPNPQSITYTYTVTPIPVDATVVLSDQDGRTQSGTSMTGLHEGDDVSYDISRTGYLTTQGTYYGIMNDTSETIAVNAYRFDPQNYYGDDNAFWYDQSDLSGGVALFYKDSFESIKVSPDNDSAFIGIDINNPPFGTFSDGAETYYPLIAYDTQMMAPLGYVCMGDSQNPDYNMPLCATISGGDTLDMVCIFNIEYENVSYPSLSFRTTGVR